MNLSCNSIPSQLYLFLLVHFSGNLSSIIKSSLLTDFKKISKSISLNSNFSIYLKNFRQSIINLAKQQMAKGRKNEKQDENYVNKGGNEQEMAKKYVTRSSVAKAKGKNDQKGQKNKSQNNGEERIRRLKRGRKEYSNDIPHSERENCSYNHPFIHQNQKKSTLTKEERFEKIRKKESVAVLRYENILQTQEKVEMSEQGKSIELPENFYIFSETRVVEPMNILTSVFNCYRILSKNLQIEDQSEQQSD